jgi:hypothetical protein
VIARRLTSQLLSGAKPVRPDAVVGRVLAVQAQDERGARLAIRVRSRGVTAADVDRALTDDRALVVTWLNRGTLHLVTAGDYWWLQPLTNPQIVTANERRLAQEGVSPAQARKGIDVVMRAVAGAPRTREDLRAHLDRAKVPTAGQALVHVLLAATIHADLIRGPMVGGRHAFVSASQWLGRPPPKLTRDEALARLAHRYLAGHSPADARDLSRWAGITLGDARRGFAAIAPDVVTDAAGLLRLRDAPAPARLPPPRLLGPFDPLLHGWTSREPFVGPYSNVVTTNGVFRASVLVGGRIVATWGLAGDTLTVRGADVDDTGLVHAAPRVLISC